MAKGGADVPCVLGRESANLIELEGVAKGSADVPCAHRRESANLIGMEGAGKVIPSEQDVRYNEIERVDHLGTDRVGVGGMEKESGKILAKPTTDGPRLAELCNHRIGITNTALDWTKDVLREVQQHGTKIGSLMKWIKRCRTVLRGRM